MRAAELARTWPQRFGREKLYQITGHTAHPMFSLMKLLWLRENQPDLLRTGRRVLCFEDLLHERLGLEPTTVGWLKSVSTCCAELGSSFRFRIAFR